jgi:ankyrin repeat protein
MFSNLVRHFPLRLFPFRLIAILLLGLTSSNLAYGGEIHDAAAKGDLNKVTKLIKDNPDAVMSKDKEGWTPLHVAAVHGHKEVAELLLANKAEINARDNRLSTPLHQAAAAPESSKALIEMLLVHGAEVNAGDKFALTPLYYAILRNNKEIMEFLLAYGADVNARDNTDGDTPLILAASDGRLEMAEYCWRTGPMSTWRTTWERLYTTPRFATTRKSCDYC